MQPENINDSPKNNQVIIDTKNMKVDDIDSIFEKDDNAQSQIEDEEDFHLEPGTLDEDTVSLMTEQLNELMDKINCNLEFKYNTEVNLMTIKMIDKKTQEVIKEVPPEEMIENMIKAKDWLGAFIDKNI
ncbi:MAG: flagellar protein FlaG [Selenomonadaceae bacterium]|nr:flagellar protein FlaG [Selenomonadaceae bacterium]